MVVLDLHDSSIQITLGPVLTVNYLFFVTDVKDLFHEIANSDFLSLMSLALFFKLFFAN